MATEPNTPNPSKASKGVSGDSTQVGPLSERFQRLDARAKHLDAVAAGIADERAVLAREMALVEAAILEGMAARRLCAVRLSDRSWLIRTEGPRALVPLWPPNQFPTELRREVVEVDEAAVREAMGAGEVLIDEDGIALAELGPARIMLELRHHAQRPNG